MREWGIATERQGGRERRIPMEKFLPKTVKSFYVLHAAWRASAAHSHHPWNLSIYSRYTEYIAIYKYKHALAISVNISRQMCRVEICATTGHQHQEATRFLYRFEHVYIYSIYAIYRTIIPMSSPTAASLLDQKIVGQFVEKYFLVSFSVIRCHLLRTVSSEDPFSQSNPSVLIVPSSVYLSVIDLKTIY